MSIKAGVLGGTGYTGTQLVSILLTHPDVEIKWITSEKWKNKQFYESFPHLKGLTDLECKSVTKIDELKEVDVVFSCLPSLTSMHFVDKFMSRNSRVIDLSPDFRFKNIKKFNEIFKTDHGFEDLNKSAVYGLSETNRKEIKDSHLVSNPGCFATSVLLPLIPLAEKGLLSGDDILMDIKAPVSGAGRAPRLDFHFPEANENMTFEGFEGHLQKQELIEIIGLKNDIVFMTHRVPVDRGILSTVYLRLKDKTSKEEPARVLTDFYSKDKFVRVRDYNETVNLKNVLNSNFCDIGLGRQGNYLVIESVIDNLIKGASGQAVQNMNIMFGMDESAGLELVPLYP